MSLTDPITEKIKLLYSLGESGQYEIIHRTIHIVGGGLLMGKTSKECVDMLMDKGVRPLELGIGLAVALSKTNPSMLNGTDSSIRCKILRENKKMLSDWEKLVEQNE